MQARNRPRLASVSRSRKQGSVATDSRSFSSAKRALPFTVPSGMPTLAAISA